MSKVDWINAYSDNNRIQKFQAGGPMAPEAEAAPQGQGPDVEGMLEEYAQTRDPQLAVAICDVLVEMIAMQQGGAPAPEAAAAPMGRRGMKMTSRAPIF